MPSLSSRQEWAAMWPLVLTATLGLSGSGLFAFSSGIFMEDVTAEFGWSRAQYSGAFVLQMSLGFFIMPVVGRFVDRYGPRRIVLIGMVPFAITISLLSLANGSIWQWWMLCGLVAFGQGMIVQTVWVTAVIGRFEAARGLAMAITLAGLSLGTMIWPPLAAFYIETFGWRIAFPALAISWLVVVMPLVLSFFFGASDESSVPKSKVPLSAYFLHLKTPTFIGLLIAGSFFASAYYGFFIHLVPMLRGNGLTLGVAASIAGLAGLFSIIGRISAGYLLDRFPTRPIAVIAFLLPAAAALLLMLGQGSTPFAICSVVLIGLASGAEMDIITFVAARRFGQEIFASVYSVMLAFIAVSASTGPMVAGAVFDASQSYDLYLILVMAMVGTGAVIMALIPITPPMDFGRDKLRLS